MGVVINHAERARKGLDFLAGRCNCSTCETHALTYHPAGYAAWCRENGQDVPEDVTERVAEQEAEKAARVAVRPSWAVLGIDLGRRTDHSAVALLVPDGAGWRFPSVVRLPLAVGAEAGGHYLTQARRLAKLVPHVVEKYGPVTVLIDATGVGEAVVEMVAEALPKDRSVQLVSVVITGGRSATHRTGRWSVSKTALIDPLVAALEQGEVSFGAFRDADVVRRELLAYRVKASSVEAGPDRLEAERQSDHDDTVIACALAVYAARRHQPMRVHAPRTGLPRTGAAGLYQRRLR